MEESGIQFTLDPIYQSSTLGVVMVIGLIAAMLLVQPSGVQGSRRIKLMVLRGAAALMLALCLLRPAMIREDNRPAAATLTIALDQSRSMTLASGESINPGSRDAGSDSRWDQQRNVLRRLAGGLSDLDENLRIRVIGYAGESETLIDSTASELANSINRLDTSIPDGMRTNLASPLRQAIDSASTNPLAGIALIGDGTQTVTAADASDGSTQSPADARREARLIGAMDVPLWTVPLGPPAGTAARRDVAIESLPESYRLFAGNEADITFEVPVRGLSGQPIRVDLSWVPESDDSTITNQNANVQPAATRTVTARQPVDTVALSVPLLAPPPGRYRLVVRAESIAGETITDNNQQIAFADVREGGGRILYLEGAIRLEQQYLRRALRNFPDLEVTFRWIPSDTKERWPIELDVELARSRYDVVILGDLAAAAIGDVQLKALAKSVSDGMALITMGGTDAYGPGGYGSSPLTPVLPVVMNNRPGVPAQSEDPISLSIDTPHPITSIRGVGGELDWKSLPPMPGANLWSRAATAAGVQVLLVDGKQRPMLVLGEYGSGRVASLAFDSTWAWWKNGQDEVHRRFWRQLILWSLAREESDEDRLDVEMDRRRIASSDRVNFQANWRSSVSAESNVGLQAEILLENGEIRAVDGRSKRSQTASGVESSLSGRVENLPPGFHRLKVSRSIADGGDLSSPQSVELSFQVIDDTRELVAAATDHGLLRQLSALSADAGGRSFRPDEIDELVRDIRDRRTSGRRAIIQKSRLGDDPASAWSMFAVFAGCLAVSWWLRRRWGLA